MRVLHAYHLFCGGAWRDPLAEHLAALQDGGFTGPMHVGLVGSPDQRHEATIELEAIRPDARIIAEADWGWEQVTLQAVRLYARKHDGAVLYAHTKGAARPSVFQDQWRQSMTRLLVHDWKSARDRLIAGRLDAVGCHWLTAEQYPGVVTSTPFPMFGGNFWMATCDYLRRLPPVRTGSRHDAEAWIGLGAPRVHDLSPGWPGERAFLRHRMRRLIAGRV